MCGPTPHGASLFRFTAYKERLVAAGVEPNEQLLFHGTENKCDGRGCHVRTLHPTTLLTHSLH